MRRDCRPCQAQHVSDSAMRAAAPSAGLEIEPGTAPPVLVPRAEAPAARPAPTRRPWPTSPAPTSPTWVRPATGEFAGYLDARRADVAEVWPDDLAEVTVAGRQRWLPEQQLDALRTAARSRTRAAARRRSIPTCRRATAT